MFTGIDEVDWVSLRHAYGSAEDVPGLLRGLASPDAAEREVALDAMYASVHHQGNVYDSTLACVPFLFALASRTEVQDRGAVVELLVSIGAESAGPRAQAAVRARAAAFVPLADDPCPGVRRAAAGALVRFLGEPARVLALLRRRITVERDEQVLLALTAALGLFVRCRPAHAAGAVELLAARSGPPYGPTVRLAALGQLGLGAPERLSADLVPTAVRLLRERSERRAAGPDRADTDTLVGRIRRLRPSDEEGSYLLRTLHRALDDRVADRIALLVGQLSSPDPMDRCNAVRMSAGLFRGWRADFSAPVELIGTQLGGEQDQLRDAAASVLTELFGLAVPAADELHRLVTVRPDLWVHTWERGRPSLGGPLKALARSGDPRAVPALSRLLARPVVPGGWASRSCIWARRPLRSHPRCGAGSARSTWTRPGPPSWLLRCWRRSPPSRTPRRCRRCCGCCAARRTGWGPGRPSSGRRCEPSTPWGRRPGLRHRSCAGSWTPGTRPWRPGRCGRRRGTRTPYSPCCCGS